MHWANPMKLRWVTCIPNPSVADDFYQDQVAWWYLPSGSAPPGEDPGGSEGMAAESYEGLVMGGRFDGS